MAFNLNYLARVSASENNDVMRQWTYNATSTGSNVTVATVAATGYLNGAQQDLTSGYEAGLLGVGDTIFIHGNDASGMYVVTTITTNVATAAFAATGVIDTANIADSAVTTDKIADGAVTSAKIGSLEIVNADVSASAAISFSKLASLTSTNILVGSAGNVATSVAVTGDVTIGNTGVTAIAAGAVVNADVNASAAIDFSKLAALSSANILVGNGGGVATSVVMSGDITIGNTGVTAIGTSKVLSAMVSPLLMKYTTIAMSAAEFNGAYAAPKLLLAAQGANTLIVLEAAQVLMTYVSAQFANGGVAHIQYDSTANGAGVIASSTQAAANFFDAASTALAFNQGIVKQPFTTAVNKGLYFSNVTGAFDTGDSTFVVHLWYRVIPTV